mgnify:FL=1
MRELATYALESIACSGIMLLLYKILMEQRVDFRICRIYLPAALIISAIIPLLDIPVWEAEVVYIQSQTNLLPAETAPVEMTTIEMEAPRSIDLRPIVWGIYMLGVAISLILMLIQLRRISLLASRGEIIRPSNPRIIRAAENISSFSFFGTIYVGRDSTDHDVESIMIHECSHIRHNHSAERVAMELLCSLMWWNPFSWIARRHLMEVHEYEADADVLKSGYDVSIYIQTILKSLLGYSPDIANGLRDSLTQKRFKMMTRKTSSRYALLRTLAIVPMLAGLLCAFSFTAKATQYIDLSNATPDRKLLEIKVTDTQGKPMKGAVIILPDGRGNKTDENGRADIKNGSVEELSFNYVGHAVKSISVDNKADKAIVNVTMDVVPQYIIGAHIFNYDKSEHRVFKMYDDNANEAIAQTAKSLNSNTQPLAEGEKRFVKVEQAVLYDGGNVNKFRNYIQSTVKYPADAIRDKVHGDVTVEFIVEADASLSNIKVTKSPDISLTDEVIRAINAAPLKWTPAMQSGEPTRMKCYMTINFSLEKDDYLRRLSTIMAETKFNGGDAAVEFKKYMQQTLRYPKLAQQTKSVGRIVASFFVDENALPCNINIITPADDILAAEVTRAIANSRGWEIIRDTKVSQDIPQSGSFFCIAVDFCMQGENGIVSAPIRKEISDERLQEMYGKNYIDAINVMVYDK